MRGLVRRSICLFPKALGREQSLRRLTREASWLLHSGPMGAGPGPAALTPLLSPDRKPRPPAWRMESGGVSAAPALSATPEGPEDGPGTHAPEPPSTDPGKLQALSIGPGAQRAAPAPRGPDSRAAVSPTKTPNRDSGIDSPTRSVPAGPFSCQGGSEAGGPTLLALHPEVAPSSKTTRKEADGNVGQEPAPKNSPPGARADLAKVGPLLPRMGLLQGV